MTQRKKKSTADQQKRNYFDLDIPILMKDGIEYGSSGKKKRKISSVHASAKEHQVLIQRLQDIGYSTIALSHTIHGRIVPERDEATTAIPSSLFDTKEMKTAKRRKLEDKSGDCRPKILRRLNVIIEQASDLAFYSSGEIDQTTEQRNSILSILNSYDLIALSPRNDAAFSSACTSTNLSYSDIVILDYTAGRGNIQLPYKLKTSDIAAATKRGITFEIPYGPALVDPLKRKAFVQTAQLLMAASVGVVQPRIILSSGNRSFEGSDYSAMVVRSPGDMENLAKTILGFHDTLVSRLIVDNSSYAASRGKDRQIGHQSKSSIKEDGKKDPVVTVSFESVLVEDAAKTKEDENTKNIEHSSRLSINAIDKENDGEHYKTNNTDEVEDGFLRF